MKLHADLQQPVAVRGANVAPVPSPVIGVERRMLERDGDEVHTLALNPIPAPSTIKFSLTMQVATRQMGNEGT